MNRLTVLQISSALVSVWLATACTSTDDTASDAADASNSENELGSGGHAGSSGAAGSSGSTSHAAGNADSSTRSDSSASTEGGAIKDGGHTLDDWRDTGGPANGVNLGTAGTYAVLSKSGISTVPTSAIAGNIGVSPAAATYMTGFSLTADASNVFAISPQVTGQVFASNYAVPTPSNLTIAISNLETAFSDAAGRAANVTELGAGDIGGMTLPPGVYKWGTGLLIPSDVKLAGDDNDVWIFQIAQNLTVANAAKVSLAGGALAKNVYWQISGSADIGTTAHFEGVVMTQTAIALHTGASINGRLLAQTAVSLDANTVTQPAQ